MGHICLPCSLARITQHECPAFRLCDFNIVVLSLPCYVPTAIGMIRVMATTRTQAILHVEYALELTSHSSVSFYPTQHVLSEGESAVDQYSSHSCVIMQVSFSARLYVDAGWLAVSLCGTHSGP